MIKSGCQHTEGPYHDCDHVDERNAIARLAEERADRTVPAPGIGVSIGAFESYLAEWRKVYLEEVELLDGRLPNGQRWMS
jgi:hypothetical protein